MIEDWEKRLVLAITGASGVIYGKRLLEVLSSLGYRIDLITTRIARLIIREELGIDPDDLSKLASRVHDEDDLSADIASGSTRFLGMVIAPCSMKTLAAIASGFSHNLVTRVADVCLKERRKLVLVIRETPLSLVHVENIRRAISSGAIVLPASPAFYHKPTRVEDLVDYVVGKILDVLGIEHDLFERWSGIHVPEE